MRADRCREWRESLGAYALGRLPAEERTALEAHLEGCSGCRAEAESLRHAAAMLPLADPERVAAPAPRPPAELGERIAASVAGEQRERRRRGRLRLGLALAGAAAVVAVALAILPLPGSGEAAPEEHVSFASLAPGVRISATLEPHAFGTQIRLYVHGIRSGTLCRVFLRGRGGATFSAGSFRYRYGEDSQATLSSGLDLSRTAAIGVHAGGRTFLAPVGPGPAA